jgi:hypothetical protein
MGFEQTELMATRWQQMKMINMWLVEVEESSCNNNIIFVFVSGEVF